KEAAPADIEMLLLRALDADPTHMAALGELETIARAAKDDERLVQLLELRLDASTEDTEKRKLLAEVAQLYKALERGTLGVPILERLVALAPDDVGAREQLADALVAAGRGDEAARIAVTLIEQLTKARRGKDAARWHQRLGALAEARGDTAAAAESFTAAYK